MNSKSFIFFILIIAMTGCASTAIPLGNGTDLSGHPVCLTSCDQIPAVIEKYKIGHDLDTEESEIDYLFYRIRSSNVKFIRNGLEANGSSASEFLRWKIGWYEKAFGEKINTDENFVGKVLSGSQKTGKPYVIVLEDGTKHNMQPIMRNELNYLNSINSQPHSKS